MKNHVRTKNLTCALGATSLVSAAAASASSAAAAACVLRCRELAAGRVGEASGGSFNRFLVLLERFVCTLHARAAPLLSLLDLAQIPERIFRVLSTHRLTIAGQRINVCSLQFLPLTLCFHICREFLGTDQLNWALRCDGGRRSWIDGGRRSWIDGGRRSWIDGGRSDFGFRRRLGRGRRGARLFVACLLLFERRARVAPARGRRGDASRSLLLPATAGCRTRPPLAERSHGAVHGTALRIARLFLFERRACVAPARSSRGNASRSLLLPASAGCRARSPASEGAHGAGDRAALRVAVSLLLERRARGAVAGCSGRNSSGSFLFPASARL